MAKFNLKVVLLSIVALAGIALAFFVHWAFIILSVVIAFYNNRLLKK
jgi:hypothetical protein